MTLNPESPELRDELSFAQKKSTAAQADGIRITLTSNLADHPLFATFRRRGTKRLFDDQLRT